MKSAPSSMPGHSSSRSLPSAEFDEEHLAGAINIPLKQMTEEAVEPLDKDRPVIVYCWDYQ
jgi:rhodanese-related sulfurtransferase